MARASNFGRSIGKLSIDGQHGQYKIEAKNIPQLIWRQEFTRNFAEFFPKVQVSRARRYCAMSLVKLCVGCTWVATARALDLPEKSSVKLANQMAGVLRSNDKTRQFGQMLNQLAKRLADSTERVDYMERRNQLSSFIDIPLDRWKPLCEAAGVKPGLIGRRSKYAAAWLWSEMTAGDWTLAPGMQGANINNMREVFRRLEKQIFPKLADSLRQYACSVVLYDATQ